jgi:hypothetical protein
MGRWIGSVRREGRGFANNLNEGRSHAIDDFSRSLVERGKWAVFATGLLGPGKE